MSVTTKADEIVQELKDNIDKSAKNVMEILDPNTWGHNDYSDEFMEKMENAFTMLLNLKRQLNK